MFEIDSELVEMSFIEPVMTSNGFTREADKFTNDNCIVEVDFNSSVFNLFWREKNSNAKCETTSDNLNLYWLFGFLAAHDLIDRNFKL